MKYAILSAAILGAAAAVASAAPRLDVDSLPTATLAGAAGRNVALSNPLTGTVQPYAAPATLFNSNGFEAYTNGNLRGQNGWTTDTAAGSTTIGAYGLTGKGARMNYTATEWAYPSVNYTPAAGEAVVMSADLARTVASTPALSTSFYGLAAYSPTSFALDTAVGLSRNSSTNDIGLAVIAPFNTTTGQFDPAGTTNFTVTIASGLTAASFYNLEVRMNFATKKVDIYSGGALFYGNIPFAYSASAQTGVSDADFYGSAAKIGDFGYLDNYVVSTIVVPEPVTIGSLALAGVGLIRRRRA